MTTRNSFNTDKSYELMAHIINDQMGPYDATTKADITEILRLCYVYSANDGKGYELSAGDLGQAIVDYLSEGYGAPNFHASSEAFWNPQKQEADERAPAAVDAPEGTQNLRTPEGMQNSQTPDGGLLIP